MITTYLKMLPLSLECDDTMWWRIDDFLVVLSFLASWVVHEHLVSHVVLLFLILLSCHLSTLSSFDSLLGLFPHSLFLFLQRISGQHIPEEIYNFKTWVIRPQFCCVPSMLMKRWCWDYFSIDFVYHVVYKHVSRQR
jgi:hypothetical protein